MRRYLYSIKNKKGVPIKPTWDKFWVQLRWHGSNLGLVGKVKPHIPHLLSNAFHRVSYTCLGLLLTSLSFWVGTWFLIWYQSGFWFYRCCIANVIGRVWVIVNKLLYFLIENSLLELYTYSLLYVIDIIYTQYIIVNLIKALS